jgi:hypothetical protein
MIITYLDEIWNTEQAMACLDYTASKLAFPLYRMVAYKGTT